MNKTKFTLVALSFFCMQQVLQAQMVKFRKVIGNTGYDYGYYAEQTPDKGYILIGSTSSFGENADMYAIKTDSMGIPQLHKSFGGINLEKGYSVKRTSDNGYILAGYTNSGGAGGYDMYMVKIDSLFATQWEKTYGGADWDFANSVQQTSDGGYILCGSTYSFGHGNQDYYLVKTDGNGDTLWTKTYGGAGDDIAKSVIQTSDGGYALTGFTKSMGDSTGDFYTIKTNAMGDTLWTNRYGGAYADMANAIIETQAGDYLVAGECTNLVPGNAVEATLIRLNAAGAYDNNETFGGGSYDTYNGLSQNAEGKIALAGSTNSFGSNGDALVVVLNSDLSFYYATTYGTLQNDQGYSIQPTADRGFIFCGYTNGYNNGLEDIYLIKTDTMGLSGSTGSETFYVTGISDPAAAQAIKFAVYPNPANSSITVNLDNSITAGETTISVTDLLGREIINMTASGTASVIDLQNLPDGLYAVTVKNPEFCASKKLVVHH